MKISKWAVGVSWFLFLLQTGFMGYLWFSIGVPKDQIFPAILVHLLWLVWFVVNILLTAEAIED